MTKINDLMNLLDFDNTEYYYNKETNKVYQSSEYNGYSDIDMDDIKRFNVVSVQEYDPLFENKLFDILDTNLTLEDCINVLKDLDTEEDYSDLNIKELRKSIKKDSKDSFDTLDNLENKRQEYLNNIIDIVLHSLDDNLIDNIDMLEFYLSQSEIYKNELYTIGVNGELLTVIANKNQTQEEFDNLTDLFEYGYYVVLTFDENTNEFNNATMMTLNQVEQLGELISNQTELYHILMGLTDTNSNNILYPEMDFIGFSKFYKELDKGHQNAINKVALIFSDNATILDYLDKQNLRLINFVHFIKELQETNLFNITKKDNSYIISQK